MSNSPSQPSKSTTPEMGYPRFAFHPKASLVLDSSVTERHLLSDSSSQGNVASSKKRSSSVGRAIPKAQQSQGKTSTPFETTTLGQTTAGFYSPKPPSSTFEELDPIDDLLDLHDSTIFGLLELEGQDNYTLSSKKSYSSQHSYEEENTESGGLGVIGTSLNPQRDFNYFGSISGSVTGGMSSSGVEGRSHVVGPPTAGHLSRLQQEYQLSKSLDDGYFLPELGFEENLSSYKMPIANTVSSSTSFTTNAKGNVSSGTTSSVGMEDYYYYQLQNQSIQQRQQVVVDPTSSVVQQQSLSPQQTLSTTSSDFSTTTQLSEHPLGEHPSRTLFIRNINSSCEDEELRLLFESFGAIRSMHTHSKHRGFVMISYYDIRDSKQAMKNLQGKILRKRKLDIHYSIPKDNPTEKDLNQGTLVVFNLDSNISNDELRSIFCKYGEIKEIRETPNKKHHKFIEFFDVRDSEKAMKALNKMDLKGKKIKIEPSRPGGIRKFFNPPDSNYWSEVSIGTGEFFYYYSPTNANVSTTTTSGSVDPVGGTQSQQTEKTKSPNSMQSTLLPRTQQELQNIGNLRSNSSSHSANTSPNITVVARGSQNAMTSHSSPQYTREDKAKSTNPFFSNNSPNRSGGNYEFEKKRFFLNIARVKAGEDKRTTLMIKNIPNKYTQKMLLQAIDVKFRGTYDFFYLPIDFKNRCNVGYAFINFIDAKSIVEFSSFLNQKRWEKFNSEKVCELTYARIQGKEALIEHFQNSSLMSEDNACRPIIFHSDGPDVGLEMPFPNPTVKIPSTNVNLTGTSNSSSTSLTSLSSVSTPVTASSQQQRHKLSYQQQQQQQQQSTYTASEDQHHPSNKHPKKSW